LDEDRDGNATLNMQIPDGIRAIIAPLCSQATFDVPSSNIVIFHVKIENDSKDAQCFLFFFNKVQRQDV
jgi:hypothetical protein